MLPDSTNKVGVLIETVANDGAITQTTAQLTVLGDTAKKAGATSVSAFESFNKSLKSVGQQMSDVGRSMTGAITLPIVGIGYEAIKSAVSFQQAMTYVRTDAGDTTDNIAQLSQQVLELAKNSQFSPDELANGLYHLASLGLRGADAINALNTAQQMAAVGGADLESTASALGAALVTGIKGVQDYTSAAGVLDATIGAGNMRMQDLVNAMGTGVLPVFKNAGLNITEFGAALATLTDNGQQADAAATHLRMTISLMEAPSKAAAKAMENIGMTANQLGMDMQTKGLVPALTDLRQHLIDTYGTTAEGKQKMAAALTEMFGGGRSSSAIQTLIDQIGRVQQKEQQIGAQSGEFATKYAEQQQTAAAQFKTAWSTVQVDLIQLGDAVMPTVAHAMTEIGKAVSNVADWFQRLSPQNKQMVIDLAMVAAAAGPVLLIFGSMAKSLSSILTLTNTVGSGILGVGKLLGGLGAIGGEGAIAGGLAEGGAAAGGLVAALGPVALGIGAVGLAAGGAYLLVKHFTDANDGLSNDLKAKVSPEVKFYDKTAKELGYTLTGTASKVNVLTLAQTAQKDSANMLKDAQGQLKTSQEKNKSAQEALTKAVKDGKTSEGDYVDALHNAVTAALDLKIKEGNLADAEKVWTKNKYDFRDAQNAVTAALKGTLGVIAEFGPKALDQVKSIDTLQAHLSTVVKSFSSLVVNIQNQAPKLIEALQGGKGSLGNAVNNLQKASSSIDLHLSSAASSAKTIQNSGISIQGGSLQGHASGSTYAPGGLTVVGEQGPELVSMPTGSKVYPARQSARMMGGNNITINQTNNNYSQFDQTTANRLLGWQLANAIG